MSDPRLPVLQDALWSADLFVDFDGEEKREDFAPAAAVTLPQLDAVDPLRLALTNPSQELIYSLIERVGLDLTSYPEEDDIRLIFASLAVEFGVIQ